jgi:hypothetical protein
MKTPLLAALGIAAFMQVSVSAAETTPTQPNLDISITMRKDVQLSDNTALYRIQFNLTGDPLKKARKVAIAIPNGKKMQVQNPLHLNIMNLEVAESDYPYLVQTFPEGQYNMRVFPKSVQGKNQLEVFLSHDFPAALSIINPPRADSVQPLSFTAEWYPIANAVDSLFVEISGPGRSYSLTLPPTATSFTVPPGLLEPNQTYRMALGVRVQSAAQGSHETAQVINFTTAAQ